MPSTLWGKLTKFHSTEQYTASSEYPKAYSNIIFMRLTSMGSFEALLMTVTDKQQLTHRQLIVIVCPLLIIHAV